MGRFAGWIVGGLAGAGMVLGTWVAAPVAAIDLSGTGVTLPSLPVDTTVAAVPLVPEVTAPPVTVPQVTVPSLPLPAVTIPTVTTPTIPVLPVPLPPVPATVPGGVGSDGLVECVHFLTQQAAQAALAVDARLAALLDSDRDGVACELLPSGPATVPNPGPGGSGPTSSGGGDGGTATTIAGSSLGSGFAGGAGPAGAREPTSGVTSTGSGAAKGDKKAATGAPTAGGRAVDIASSPLSATQPLGDDVEGKGDGGHLALTILAFVLLLGTAAGTAREVAARD